MLQFSRHPGRHPAATAVSTFRSTLTALRTIRTRVMAQAGLVLALALIPAVALTTGGCGGDDDDGVVDGGRDGGTLAACKPSDCPGPMPTMHTCMTGTASFTCALNIDLRCAWLNPRCTGGNGNADAVGASDGPQDAGAAGDSGSEDAAGNDAAEDAGD